MAIYKKICRAVTSLILSDKSLTFMTLGIAFDERYIEKLLGDEFFLSRILHYRNAESAFLGVVNDDCVLDFEVSQDAILEKFFKNDIFIENAASHTHFLEKLFAQDRLFRWLSDNKEAIKR